MEPVRGSVTDRPWAQTLVAIGVRRHTGSLTLDTDKHRFCITFRDGNIIAASSPLAADAITRVALTNHLITSTQASEIQRRLAFPPDRDEVDVLAEALEFTAEQVDTLRRRLITQRAARTFSIEQGTFVIDADTPLPIAPGVAIDFRHVIYLGVRMHLAEQRLLDDLRQLGSHFILKLEAHDDLAKFGFDASADVVIDALRSGTSLPELEAAHRELDPRSAQAIIYSLVACGACVPLPRTMTQPAVSRTATPSPAVGRSNTTQSPTVGRSMTVRGQPDDGRIPAARQPLVSPRTATAANPRTTTPIPARAAGGSANGLEIERASTTQPPLATGTASFSNTTPLANGTPGPAPTPRPPSTTPPMLPRTNTTSPTSYSTKGAPDSGENTPIRPRNASEPATARTRTPMPTRTPTPPSTPPRADQRPTTPMPATPRATTPPTDMDAVKFSAPTTPPPARGAATTRPPARPNAPTLPASNEDSGRFGFGEQRTPLPFGEQRTPAPFAEQRTPTGFGEQRTPPNDRTPTGQTRAPGARATTGNNPVIQRTTTDNAAAATEAFKRGELAMKRDQPGEAVLEFKTACDLNPNDPDYAGMLAWAKFCAAGDKQSIGGDTRKVLERAVFKSNHPERARFYLGRVERMLGRDKEALRHFHEVLDLVPNHAEAAAEIRAIEGRMPPKGGGGGLFGRKK